MQIQGVLNNTQDPNERHILIKNINEELRGSEVSLASNKKTSYVVQTILENCNRDQLRLFLSYSKDFAIHMFTQTYASHPMQTALEMANKFLSESVEEDQHALMKRMDEEPLESLVDLVNIFVENILPSLSIVCCDVNGSHVIRYLLCILMGCPSSCGTIKKHIVKGSLEKKMNATLLETFDEARSAVLFAIAELESADREYLMKNPNSCFIVQLLMNYLPMDQRTKLAHILMNVENEETSVKLLQDLIIDSNGSRSLEVLIRSASEEVVNKYFRLVVIDRIVELANNLRSNFVLQMFLSRITDVSLTSKAFDALSDQVESLYNSKKTGVILQLVNACRRCQTREEACFGKLMDTLQKVLKIESREKDFYSRVLNESIAMTKEGGHVKLDESRSALIFELMQFSPPWGNHLVIPLLKWTVETILRVYLSCSTGRKMIRWVVDQMEEKDRKMWMEVMKGLKAEDAPIVINEIKESRVNEMKVSLSRLRLRLKREVKVTRTGQEKKEKKEKEVKKKKTEKKTNEKKENSNVASVAHLLGYYHVCSIKQINLTSI